MNPRVSLRPVLNSDIPIFYEHQRDPEAAQMAAFPARDQEKHNAHWAKILKDENCIKKTILLDSQVTGNIVSWEQSGRRLVGYWIGKEFWGQGVATRALELFVKEVQERPLYAFVAKHNLGSIRVLEKCGFIVQSEEAHEDGLVELLMMLK